MAKSTSVVSDSDGNPRDASELLNDKAGEEERENGVGEDEDEEEYEIEEILNHERNKFEGRMGYFCKWKGYGPESNSWVDEEDAGNATELIEAYWKKKKTGRKSADHSTKKGRASAVADSPEPLSAPKKRGRKSAVAKDEEEEDNQAVKRQKTKKTTRKKIETPEPEDIVMEDSEEQIADGKYMTKFMSLSSWEEIVGTIDTVERPSEKGPLMVYFRLKKEEGGNRVRLPSMVCREKFPQALLDFYESNLKWKETEVDDDGL
ncbi:hypothetical protein D9758_008727 [Tetrapyrgos nigripes]|uniref:Chromo domain-containing protein n=1 Tax=Tetrapyrgos nigripes TaxID=182062 RepID=A0A8H5D6H2_9AGAR|nr:hypothetical protein D9758_008727 [Tetrapyrgos nigripes]